MKFPSEWVLRWRWPIIVGYLLFTALFMIFLPNLEIDPEIKNQLPPDMPSRLNVHRIEETFGGSEMIMVVVTAEDVLAPDTLKRVKAISDGLAAVPTINRVVSPFTLNDIHGSLDGTMAVEPAIGDVPTTDADREALRERLKSNDLVFGNVLAQDFTAVSVIGMLSAEATDSATIRAVRAVVDANPGPEAVVLGGMPDVRQHVSEDIRSDVRRFGPVGLVVIIGFLFVTLRQARGVFVPFTVQTLAIVVSVGLIPLLAWKVQMVTVVLPVILLAVGNDHAIHIIARFQEENVPGNTETPSQIVTRVLAELGLPVLAAGTTTIAGFLCLLTHIVVPAAQLGVLAAWGVTFAMFASLMFVPAVLSVLPKPKPLPGMGNHDQNNALDRLLHWNARFVGRNPKLVVGVLVALAVAGSAGFPLLKVDTNPVNYYPSDAPVAQTAGLINQHFGGSTEISVMIEGDIQDPEVLKKIDALEAKLNTLPQVGYTMSIAKVVRKMHLAVGGGDASFDRIPDSREAVAQLFLLYSMGGSTEDFERMVDFEYQHALVTARVNSLSTEAIAEVVETIRVETETSFPGHATIGGFGSVFAALVDAVVSGQVSSLSLSLVICGVLVALCFGSVGAGLWSLVPLVVATPMLFGLMGWWGIELNVVTAMLSSIMIGVGVDYTIHFLWRYREERREGHSPEEASFRTLTTVGRGIVFNALSVVFGFSILLLSNFLPVRFFGFLVVVSIGGCLVAALMLMPPLMILADPKFARPLEGKAKAQAA